MPRPPRGAPQNNDAATARHTTEGAPPPHNAPAGPAVASTNAHTAPAGGKQPAAGGPVETGVAEDHLVTGRCTTV